MKNTSYQHNPLKWSDYYGQEGAVKLAKQFILNGVNDENGLPRCLYISGPSGVGKTAYVRLLLRSLRCLNRQDGEYEPCGVCEHCTNDLDERTGGKTYGDTIWIQPGGRERGTLQSQVKEALALAAQGQTHTGRPERDCLKIVLDEFQAFPADVRQELLLKTEVEQQSNNVMFIFVTMREDRIHLQERIAIIRRSCPIAFSPFTPDQIQGYLKDKFPSAPTETLELVSNNSENSIGLALSYMELINSQDADFHIDVAAHLLCMATPTERWYVWETLEQNGDFMELKTATTNLECQVSPHRLAQQMVEDIMRSITTTPTKEQLFALEQLNYYLRSYTQLNLLAHLASFSGLKKIVNRDAVFAHNPSLNYAL